MGARCGAGCALLSWVPWGVTMSSASKYLEPGPELRKKLDELEQRLASRPGSPVSAADVLLLVASIRQLLRDREALLEEIEALETAAGAPGRGRSS